MLDHTLVVDAAPTGRALRFASYRIRASSAIYELDLDTGVRRLLAGNAGVEPELRFVSPRGIASMGDVFVADHSRMLTVDPDTGARVVGPALPSGPAFAYEGSIWVVSPFWDRLSVLDPVTDELAEFSPNAHPSTLQQRWSDVAVVGDTVGLLDRNGVRAIHRGREERRVSWDAREVGAWAVNGSVAYVGYRAPGGVGIDRVDFVTGAVTEWLAPQRDVDDLEALAILPDGRLVGVADRLHLFGPEPGRRESVSTEASVMDLAVGPGGRVWLLTHQEDAAPGLSLFDPDTHIFTALELPAEGVDPTGAVRLAAADDALWLVAGDARMVVVQPSTGERREVLLGERDVHGLVGVRIFGSRVILIDRHGARVAELDPVTEEVVGLVQRPRSHT